MSRFKHLPPSWWVMIAVWLVAIILLVTYLVCRWELPWLLTVLVLVSFYSNIFAFRQMWKKTDHPAFHPSAPDFDGKPEGN